MSLSDDDDKYDGPSAALLEVAAIVSPLLRSMSKKVTDRRVKVYNRETGEVVGEATIGDTVNGLAKAQQLLVEVDPDIRPTEFICKYCGKPGKIVARGGALPTLCAGGCDCENKCGNKASRNSIVLAVKQERKAKCKECVNKDRAERLRKAHEAITPEQRSEIARKGNAARTTEERRNSARNARYARITPEQRSEIARKREAHITPEQKTTAARKAWETRRANAEAKKREDAK